MGWFGWTEEQTLRADVNAILVAYFGRIDMLQTIFGKPKEQQFINPGGPLQPPQNHKLTPRAFDRVFTPPAQRRRR